MTFDAQAMLVAPGPVGPEKARPARRLVRVIARLNVGGPARQAALLSGALAPRYRSLLVTGSVSPGEADMSWYARERGAKVLRLPELGRRIRPWSDVVALWKLYRVCRRVRPAIVHTHTAKAGALGRVAAWLAGVPVRVHTYHGHVFHGYFSPLRTAAVLAVERALARITTRLVVISPSQAEEIAHYLRLPRERIRVVPLGLEFDHLATADPAGDRERFRESIRAAPEDVVLTAVGRFTAIKNHELALAALARLPRERRYLLALVGGGEREGELRSLAAELGVADRVRFAGWLRDLGPVYHGSDVILLTSINEGTPVCLIEALVCGTPVVATDVGGVRDVLDGGRFGRIVPSGDVPALVAAIEGTVREGGAGDAARRESALARYSAQRLARDLEELYEQEWRTRHHRAGGGWRSLPRRTVRMRSSMHWLVARAAVLVGALTLASKIAVVGKETLLASRFGTGDALDAFLIAYLLPASAVAVITGSVQSSLLPTYVEVRSREGEAAAADLLGNVLAAAVVLLLGAAVLCAAIGVPVIRLLGAGFPPEKLALTHTLFFMLLPILVLTGPSAVWATALNATERFGVVAAAQLATPLAIVVALVGFAGRFGIQAVAAGTVAGAAAEACIVGGWLARHQGGVRPAWRGLSPATRRVAGQLTPMLAGAFLMTSSTFIDQGMAARLGSGAVSALSFGSRLVTGVLGIASVALGTAVFPHFSKLVASRDRAGAVSLLRVYLALIAAVSAPLLLLLILYSDDLVALLFQHGSFTAADTEIVSRVQVLFALQIPFYLGSLLGVRLISALKGNAILLRIAVITVVANVVGNLVLMRLLGVAGIALSTSIVYLMSFLVVMYAVHNALKGMRNGELQ